MPKYLWTRNGVNVFVNDPATNNVPPVIADPVPPMAQNPLLVASPVAVAIPTEAAIMPYVHPVDPNAPLGSFENPYPYVGSREPRQHHVPAAAEGSSSNAHRDDGGSPGWEVAPVPERAVVHTHADNMEQETDSRIYDTYHWPISRSREQQPQDRSNARRLTRRSEPPGRPRGVIEAPRTPLPVHRSTQERSPSRPLTTTRQGYQRPSVADETDDHNRDETTAIQRHVRFRPGPDSEINGIPPSRPLIREGIDFSHVRPFGVGEDVRTDTHRRTTVPSSRTAPLPTTRATPPQRTRETDPAPTGHRTSPRPSGQPTAQAPLREGRPRDRGNQLMQHGEPQRRTSDRSSRSASRRRRFTQELCGPNCELQPHPHCHAPPDNQSNNPELDTDFALALAMSLEERGEQRREHHPPAIVPEIPFADTPRWPPCDICRDKPQQVKDHGTGFCYGCYGEAQAATKVLEREGRRRTR